MNLTAEQIRIAPQPQKADIGRISKATYFDLPKRFQRAAVELARMGEIVIEGRVEGYDERGLNTDHS